MNKAGVADSAAWAHIGNMAKEFAHTGWMVKVVTPQLGGAAPLEHWFMAGFSFGRDAEKAVRERNPGDVVKVHRSLSKSEIKTFGLRTDEVRQHV